MRQALDAAAVSSAFEVHLEQLDVVGAGLGLRVGDDVISIGAGNCDLRATTPVAVDGETLFQVGSISKTFTATLVVILAERQLLNLDERVRTYLPHLELADPVTADALTVRHLLQHTGGWEGDYTLALGAQAGGSDRNAMANSVKSLRGAEVFGLPGTWFSYNNGAFELCGALVESVCPGCLFEEVLYEEVIAPLGLERTFLYSDADGEGESHIYSPEQPTTPGRSTAVGHTKDKSNWVYAYPWYDPMGRGGYGDGGIVCSAADLAAWGSYWLTDDGAPLALSASAKKQMVTPAVSTNTPGESCGLAWFIRPLGVLRMISHSGGMNGQISLLAIMPEADCVVAIATNSSTGGALTDAFLEWVMTDVLNLELPPLPGPAGAVKMPGLSVRNFVGDYFNEGSLSFVSVREGSRGCLAVKTKLHTKALGYQDDDKEDKGERNDDTSTQLARLVGPDTFLLEPEGGRAVEPGETIGAEYLQFHRGESGLVEWVCTHRLLRRHQARPDPPKPRL